MWKFITYLLFGYLLYRFVTGFVIPVFRTGKQIKKQFNNMQERMQEQMNQQQAGATPHPKPSPDKTPVGEYIDFEEVK
jgi:hypothetical protein